MRAAQSPSRFATPRARFTPAPAGFATSRDRAEVVWQNDAIVNAGGRPVSSPVFTTKRLAFLMSRTSA